VKLWLVIVEIEIPILAKDEGSALGKPLREALRDITAEDFASARLASPVKEGIYLPSILDRGSDLVWGTHSANVSFDDAVRIHLGEPDALALLGEEA
jgi:hypothetical protein